MGVTCPCCVQQLQQLEKSSHEQLVSILLDLTWSDRELLNQLLIRLVIGNAIDYQRVVNDALRAGRGEYGFIDYAGSNRAALSKTLDNIESSVGKPSEAASFVILIWS